MHAGACLFFDGPVMPLLTAARDLVHQGWTLLNHPLYGNFRPHQQPYRSLLLRPSAAPPPPNGAGGVVTDMMSLGLIEEAFTVYRSAVPLHPDDAPQALRQACALLDFELMRLPLQQAGLLGDFPGPAPGNSPGSATHASPRRWP